MAEQISTSESAGLDRLPDSVKRAVAALQELAAPLADLKRSVAELGKNDNAFTGMIDRFRSLGSAIRAADEEIRVLGKSLEGWASGPLAAIGKLGDAFSHLKNTVLPGVSERFKTLDLETKPFHDEIKALHKSLEKLTFGPLSAIGKLGGEAFSYLKGTAIPEMIKGPAEDEKYKMMLTRLMGSETKADTAMTWIGTFARQTPFDSKNTGDAFVTLTNQGIDPTNGSLQALGDAAAALDKPLKEVVAAFVSGTMGSMKPLEALGIKSETKDNVISMTFRNKEGAEKTLTAAKDKAVELQKTILEIFEAKGFTGAMDSASKTWDGMWGSLQESVSNFWGKIGEAGTFQYLEGKLRTVLALVQGWEKDGTLDAWAKRISDAVVEVFTLIETTLAGVDWGTVWVKLSTGIAKFIADVKSVADAVGGWANAFLIVAAVLDIGVIMSVVSVIAQIARLLAVVLQVIIGMTAAILGVGLGVAALVVLAVTAVAAAGVYIYAYWDDITGYAQKKWNDLKAWFSVNGITDWIPDWMKGAPDDKAPKAVPGNGKTPPEAGQGAGVSSGVAATLLAGTMAVGSPAVAHDIANPLPPLRTEGAAATAAQAGREAAASTRAASLASLDSLMQALTVSPTAAILPPPSGEAAPVSVSPALITAIGSSGSGPAVIRAARNPLPRESATLDAAVAALPGGDEVGIGAVSPMAGFLAPASPAMAGNGASSRTINAPVTVSITVNGMADLDSLQWEVENAVRRAMSEWSDRQQSDATASLHDLY